MAALRVPEFTRDVLMFYIVIRHFELSHQNTNTSSLLNIALLASSHSLKANLVNGKHVADTKISER
jgi:hypothetical protein